MNKQHPNTSIKRCAIYARAKPPQNLVELQIKTCREMAETMGWRLSEQHVFHDKGHDALVTLSERPGLRSLIEAATSTTRPFDVLIVDSAARFSRNIRDVLSVISSLSRAGVAVRIASIPPARSPAAQHSWMLGTRSIPGM